MTKDQNWREEFYREFSYIQAIKNEASGNSYKNLADFIQNLLDKAREEERERIKEGLTLLIFKSEHRSGELDCSQGGYEYGVEDAINLINQKGE